MNTSAEGVDQRVLHKYEILQLIRRSSCIVWKAMEKETGQLVEVKKIFGIYENTNEAVNGLREIMFLQELHSHGNIIKFLNVIKAQNDSDIYLITEYVESNLHTVIRAGNVLESIHKAYVTYQLLKALKYMHSANVIHRALFPNILEISSDCTVKVNNFESACCLDAEFDDYPRCYNPYKPPEILLGATKNTTNGDMWAIGCILGEMHAGRLMFPHTTISDQIKKMISLVGTPEDLASSPYTISDIDPISAQKPNSLSELLPDAPKDALDLLQRLLVINPDKRISAEEALSHPYVSAFHNPKDEPISTKTIHIPCNSDPMFAIGERSNLVARILEKKKEIRQSSSRVD